VCAQMAIDDGRFGGSFPLLFTNTSICAVKGGGQTGLVQLAKPIDQMTGRIARVRERRIHTAVL